MLAIAITVKFQPGIAVYDAHVNYFCRVSDVKHVQTCTRPSRFSACNIEKLGKGLGTRLGYLHVIRGPGIITSGIAR